MPFFATLMILFAFSYYRATVEDVPAEQQAYVVNLLGEVKCLSCDLIVDGDRCVSGSASFSKGFSYYVKACTAPNPPFIVLASTKNVCRSHKQYPKVFIIIYITPGF